MELEVAEPRMPTLDMFTPQGMESMGIDFKDMFGGMFGGKKTRKRMKVSEARRILVTEEEEKLIDHTQVEAITATGASTLQVLRCGVVPQVIPPFLSFTIYRWDINVRMSTIIGFAGGGGIGFLLLQNLNLLKYRQAAVQMIAIAIVVASLDYVSARIRERII